MFSSEHPFAVFISPCLIWCSLYETCSVGSRGEDEDNFVVKVTVITAALRRPQWCMYRWPIQPFCSVTSHNFLLCSQQAKLIITAVTTGVCHTNVNTHCFPFYWKKLYCFSFSSIEGLFHFPCFVYIWKTFLVTFLFQWDWKQQALTWESFKLHF